MSFSYGFFSGTCAVGLGKFEVEGFLEHVQQDMLRSSDGLVAGYYHYRGISPE